MASLTGNLVAETYKALLKTIDNDILTASEKQITDGLGGGSNVFIDSNGFLRANKYKVTNGLATQFLKADGSLDANTYLTSITGAQVITALGYTPVTDQRTLTINGVTYNLTANRSWTVAGTAAVWGNITGTLSNQTDLQNALNAKFNNPAGTISQYIRGDGSLATFPTLPGGLPIGGTAGQILAKINSTDYNAEWIDNFATQTKNEVKLGQTLAKGAAVYVSSANGTNIIVSAASNTTEALSSKTFGLLETGGSTNAFVKCVTFGLLAGLDTSTATAGDPVWLGVNGALIFGLANKPYAPAHLVYIGVVTRVQSNNGEIFVNVQNGFELKEIHDVSAQTPSNNDGLFYESATSLWKNKSIATVLGYTPQAQLSGTGFVKASGTTISYDNSTYLTTADAASTYQLLTNLSTDLTASATKYPSVNAVIAGLATKQPLDADLTAIAALAGTSGFLIKTAADTWSLDTNTYLTTATAASTYQRLDKMVSNLLASDTEYPNSNAVIAALALKANAANPVFTGNMTISGAEPKLTFTDTDQNPDYFIGVDAGFFRIFDQTAGATRFVINSDGNISAGVGKSITAGSFVKESGTAAQFLKADGSIDSSTYVTSASLANYLLITTAASTYQRLDKMVSNLLASDTEYPNSNAVLAKLALKADAANPVFTGDLSISGATPRLYFVDTDQNPDYTVFVDSGFFYIYDQTAGATRFSINSSGNATFNKRVTFQSGIDERPQMPGGFIGLDTGDGDFDIWGISREYYPSHPTTANKWGIRWNGTNNDLEFVGAGTNRAIIDLDNGTITGGSFVKSGGTSSQYLMADGSVSTLSGLITGLGTTNRMAKFTGASTIGNSLLFDDGSSIGLGANPSAWAAGTEGVFQTKNASVYGYSNYEAGLVANAYFSSNWYRIASPAASMIILNSNITLRVAGTGLAGSAITWVDAFNITNTGKGEFNNTVTSRNASTSASLGLPTFMGAGEFMSTGTSAGIFWENRSGGVTSGSNWYGWYTTAGSIKLYNGFSNILSIDGSSGAAAFTSTLTTVGSATFGGDVFTYNNGGIFFSGAGAFTSGVFQNANGLNLQTGSTPRMKIDNSGNFDYGGFNVQSSNNAAYRQAFWGGISILWRNSYDVYFNSNHTYSSSSTNVATYTNPDGIGRISISGGNFEWASYNGTVTAGTAYTLSSSFIINKAGKVGIGHTSPLCNLHIEAPSASYGQFRITSTSNSGGEASINFGRTDQGIDARWTVGQGVASITDSFGFYTGGSVKLAITTGGNVLIGTTTDNGLKLQVQGSAGFTGGITVNRDANSTNYNGSLSLWSEINGTTSNFKFNQTAAAGWGTMGDIGDYATYFSMDTANRGWIFRFVNGGSSTNVASIQNNDGRFATGADFVGRPTHAQINVCKGLGAATLYRDIDIRGSWAGGEGHAITAIHGSSTANIVGQMVFQHDSPGSRIRFGRLYHGGDSSTYTMELISTSATAANLTVLGSVTATSFFESSDFRLKTLIESNPIINGIEKLEAKLYEKNGKIELGYFAQDAELIMPYAVTKNEDGFLNLSYREVHTAKIARLEKEVAELKEKLNLN
jgi:hypothetical protein